MRTDTRNQKADRLANAKNEGEVWKIVNEIIKPKSSPHIVLSTNDGEVTDDLEIANKFNEYFIQKIEDLSVLIETLNPASPAKHSAYSVPSTSAMPPAATTPRHLPMSSAVAVSAARAAAAFTSSAAAAAAAVPDFTSSPPLRSLSSSNPQPASTASPDSVFFSGCTPHLFSACSPSTVGIIVDTVPSFQTSKSPSTKTYN